MFAQSGEKLSLRREEEAWLCDSLAPGDYVVAFEDGSGLAPAQGVHLKAGEKEEVLLDLRGRSRLSIRGRLIAGFDTPFRVEATPSPFGSTTSISLIEGRAETVLPRGEWRVRWILGEIVILEESWWLDSADVAIERRFEPELAPALVIGADGRPAAGCRVEYSRTGESDPVRFAETGEDGRAPVLVARGMLYDFRVDAGERGVHFFPAHQAPSDGQELVLAFEGSGELLVRVRTESGEPFSGCVVQLNGPRGEVGRIVTDADGVALFRDLPGGWYYPRWIGVKTESGDLSASLFWPYVRVSAGARAEVVVVAAEPEVGPVAGVVVHDGKGVGGVTVMASALGIQQTKTDSRGRFRFPRVRGDQVRLSTTPEPGHPYGFSFTLSRPGAEDVVIEVPLACRLEVDLLAPELTPLEQGLSFVEYRVPGSPRGTQVGMGRAAGGRRFTAVLVPAHATEVRVGGIGLTRSEWIPVSLSGGGTTRIEVRLERSQDVACRFDRPFSGLLAVYGRSGGNWTSLPVTRVIHPVATCGLHRAGLLFDEYRVLAFPVEGGEIRGSVSPGAGTDVVVPVSEHGGARIVVRGAEAGFAGLTRLVLDGWADMPDLAFGELVGGLPNEWRIQPLRRDAGPGAPVVFGGLLPGRYQVHWTSVDGRREFELVVASGESVQLEIE